MTPTCKNLRKLSSNNVFQKHGVLISKHVVSENVFFEVHTFLKSRLKKDELKPSTFDATTCSCLYNAHQGRDPKVTSPPQLHDLNPRTPDTPALPSTTTLNAGSQGHQHAPAPLPHPRTSGKPAFTSTTSPHPGNPVRGT